MTGKIKCAGRDAISAGLHQPSATSESGKAFYWRCAERNGRGYGRLAGGCAEALYSGRRSAFPNLTMPSLEKRIDHIDVLSATEMVFFISRTAVRSDAHIWVLWDSFDGSAPIRAFFRR